MDGSFRPPADPTEPSGPTIEDERLPGTAVFDVAPVGRRRRIPDRALVLGAMAALVVGLAVVKPWADPDARAALVPSDAPRTVSLDPSPQRSEPPGPLVGRSRLPAWDEVVVQLDPRSAWGVRALSDAVGSSDSMVHLGDGSRFDVEWVPATTDEAVRVGGTAPIRLISVTTPNDQPPLDIRVWQRVRWTEEPVRVSVHRLRGDPGTGESLLASSGSLDRDDGAWSPGTYRFELLLSDRIASLDVVIPGPKLSDGTLRMPSGPQDAPAARREAMSQASPEPSFDPAVAPIPVAVVGSVAVPLAARLTAPLEAREAWLGARAGLKPDRAPALERFDDPDVAALGVAVPRGAELTSLEAWRIGGTSGALTTRRVVDPDGGRVIVLVREGSAGWLAGAYRVDVGWTEPGGRAVEASYHVDLDPGPATATPRLLAAVRGWARHAGSQGIVVGTVEPLEGGPAAAAIRLLPQPPNSAARTVEALGDRCAAGGVLADTVQSVLGVAHRLDEPVVQVTVERLFVGARSLPVPVRASIDPLPGLVVMTPVDPEGWQIGHYRIVLRGSDGRELRHMVCLGPGPGGRAGVPAEASSRRAYFEAGKRG